MHNSCLILVVISRKYCLSLSQQNSLSRCPLKKKNLNLEKAQNLSKRKALRNNQSCQLVQLSVLQRFQGLKMLKVPDAIICYSCYHYVLVFAEININFHLYINGVSLLACFLQCACMNTHMLFAGNSSAWTTWAGSDFSFSLKFFRFLIAFNYKSIQMGKEKLYIQLGLTSCADHHPTYQKERSAKGVFPEDYLSF